MYNIIHIMYIIIMSSQFARQVTGLWVTRIHHRIRHAILNYGKANPSKMVNFSLLFILKGEIEVNTGDRAFLAAKGCCVLGEPGGTLLLKASPKTPPTYYAMSFTPQSENSGAMTLSDLGLEPIFRVQNFKEVSTLLDRMNKTFHSNDKYRPIRCSILGLELFLALKPHPGILPSTFNRPDNRDSIDRLDEAVAYIHKNYKRRLALKTLADKVSLHPNNFIRLFRKSTGLTPHQYLLRLKIEKARDFLLFYKESPVVAAQELGFHDYAHFSRVFKKQTGMSPKEFREKKRTA